MRGFTLHVGTHFVKATGYDMQGRMALRAYGERFSTMKYGKEGNKWRWVIDKSFFTAFADFSEIRVHRHQLDDLINFLMSKGLRREEIKVIYLKAPAPYAVKLALNPKYPPYDYQAPIIDTGLKMEPSYTVPLFTGGGKTLVACAIAAGRAVRFGVTIRGKYVDKWKNDVKENLKLKPSEIYIVRGSRHLIGVIEAVKKGKLKEKCLLFTNRTLYDFIDHYEQSCGDTSFYGCSPEELWGLLGLGFIIRDEVHEDFHLNFRLDLYTNVKSTLNLSATLESDKPAINKIYDIMMPHNTRYHGITFVPHAAVTALMYRFHSMRGIKYKSMGKGSYSHLIFEESIMKIPKLCELYIDMLANITDNIYMKRRKPGMKFILYCARVDMCTAVMEAFRKRWPKEKINRYAASVDEPEEYKTAELIITTLQSLGTAIDIPGLYSVFMTACVNDRQLNQQAFGRLRAMKGEFAGIVPQFYYLICGDLDKHLYYHDHKKEVLKGKTVSYRSINTGYILKLK